MPASWGTLKKCQAPSPEVRLIGPGLNICKAPTGLQTQPERRLTSHRDLKPCHSGALGRWQWVGCSVLKLLIPANPCTRPNNITPSAVLSTWRHHSRKALCSGKVFGLRVAQAEPDFTIRTHHISIWEEKLNVSFSGS